ncbi:MULTISPECIES: hypothetical protein [unclassified Clostridium]|uniref:hypothetical protein n=1 Tax=unclassified Clostridium TaxID=2614128 RepID=UPI00029766BD|nr:MULTISPECIES: hypothetical protein [unclassified Clostridium]EKQ52738.1 MAG: hypothetical protein A370_04043 [Clostridium sp. Maddingley MBC34-26]
MSKFFNVTLNKDIAIDDSVTNESSGWSGVKILQEILNHRITKFEQMEDVDVINKKDKQVVMFSGDTGKFTTIDFKSVGDMAGIGLNQISKLGVTGTTSAPTVIDIPISTVDFKVPRVNVLKFHTGDSNVVSVKSSFSNSENNDFESDSMIVFDGTAHLKTNIQDTFVYERSLSSFDTYKATIENEFKSISSVDNITSGVDNVLTVTGIATDRLLIPKGDINLSNVNNIDNFAVVASSSTTGVKIVCSPDSGNTWYTFNTSSNSWVVISLSKDNLINSGMTVDVFNAISSTYWNILIKNSKVRFAYLIRDTNTLDQLSIQYDGIGYWIAAKDTEYDTIYASNSLLQVKLYFSGDVKINY